MKIYPPWYLLTDKKRISFFEEELARELHLSHRLYGLKAKCFAKSDSNDDVAFEIEDGSIAVVHLTYSVESSGNFPGYKKFQSSESWLVNVKLNFLTMLNINSELTEFGCLVLDLILGHVNIKDFELYVYEANHLESELGSDLYLDLISSDFKSSYSVANVLNEWYKNINQDSVPDLRGLAREYTKS